MVYKECQKFKKQSEQVNKADGGHRRELRQRMADALGMTLALEIVTGDCHDAISTAPSGNFAMLTARPLAMVGWPTTTLKVACSPLPFMAQRRAS